MCDFSGKLIAWMDRELPDQDAADVDRHVRNCSECRRRVQTYEQVSRELVAYCDAVAGKIVGKKTGRRPPRWVPVLASAAAAAALLLLFLVFQPASFQSASVQPASVKQVPARPQVARVADASPVVVLEAAPKPVRKIHRGHGIRRQQTANANWTSSEPVIQIAIPVEAMFPPGAVPEGITIIADVSIASDGSVQGLRLQQ